MTVGDGVHDALRRVCPDTEAATATDTVGGTASRYTAYPHSVAQVSQLARTAAAQGLTMVPRGSGTKLDWGTGPRVCDLIVDLTGLDTILEHTDADMVMRVEAGVTMRQLGERAAAAGQQLAVDVPGYDGTPAAGAGTVGGAIATACGGSRRLRYGSCRDLLLGITVVRADGVIANSGSRVVKNVAGYDLPKLFTGSMGTLGIIVAATFRLHPLPAAVAWVTATGDVTETARACGLVLAGQHAATAVDLDRPRAGGPITMVAMFEGTPDGVAARAGGVARLWGGAVSDTAPDWFGRFPCGPNDTALKICVPPAALPVMCDAVAAAEADHGLAVALRGSAAGVLYAGVPAEAQASRVAGFIAALRLALAGCGGHLVVVHAPAQVRESVDMWGPVQPNALQLMRRVKDRFDPERRLSPGRFAGGI